MERIDLNSAMASLPSLLERVRSQGATFELVRGNEVVARLGPESSKAGMKDFDRLFENLPPMGTLAQAGS